MATPAPMAAPTTTPLDSIKGLYDLINGTTTSKSGGTQTKTESSSISQEGMNEMLKSALSNTNGLAAVAGGQRTAGGYGSVTNQLLVNDLMTRTSSQIAQANSTKTTTVSDPGSKTTVGGVTAGGTSKLAALLGGLQALDKSGTGSWLKKQLNIGSDSPAEISGGGQSVYSNPANETGNPNVYSNSSSNMSIESGMNLDINPVSQSFDSTTGNPNVYSTSGANVDFTAPDFSTLEGIGIDVGSVSSSPAMTEDPLAFLDGMADGGQVTGKKQNILGTSQFNQVKPVANTSQGSGTNPAGGPAISSDGTVISTPAERFNSGNFGGSGNGNVNPGSGFTGDAADNRSMVSGIGTAARVAGALSGVPGLSQVGSVLGIAGSTNPVAAAGLTVANMATNGIAGAAFGLANKFSAASVMDVAAAISNPAIGVANSVLGMMGLNSLGTAAENAYGSMSVDGPTSVSEAFNPMTQNIQVQQQDLTENAPVDSPENAVNAAVANDMEGDPMDNLMSVTDAFGTAGPGGGGNFGNSPTGGNTAHEGDSSHGSAGAPSSASSTSSPGLADGRLVNAPGDGTVDTKLVPLANEEYVLPADVVKKVGVDKLDALVDKYHVPVAVQRLQKFARG